MGSRPCRVLQREASLGLPWSQWQKGWRKAGSAGVWRAYVCGEGIWVPIHPMLAAEMLMKPKINAAPVSD